MSGILWICTLSVVLVLIQWQSMNAYAVTSDTLEGATETDFNYRQTSSLDFFDGASGPYSSQGPTSSKPTSTPKPNSSQEPFSTTERRTPTTKHPASGRILLAITIVLGSLLLITLIVLAIFCSLTRLGSNCRTRSLDREEIIGQDNLAYRQSRSLSNEELEMEFGGSPQSDAGFNKPHAYSGGHCQILDNANGRPDNSYPDHLDSKGATVTLSEIDNELKALDSPNCSKEAQRNHPLTSLPKSVTKPEATLLCTGGEFSAQGCSNWESVPNESERVSQFQAIFTVKDDSIDSKTSRNIATVYASRPNPRSDLIYLRFYVYSDNEDSKMRVKLAEEERFPDSRPAREKPFKMHKHSREFTVKLTDLEDGWNSDKPDDTQIYRYHEDRSGSQSIDACDFAVKPEDGRDVNGFNCNVKFQQEGGDEEHSFYLNPGFTPLKRQSIRRSSAEGGRSDNTTSTAKYEGSEHLDHYLSSLGSELVTEEHIYLISPEVGRNWKDLLRGLSIKEKAIENLSLDLKHETTNEHCIQGLIKWKERDPQSATIKTLAIALHDVGCFDALRTLQKLR